MLRSDFVACVRFMVALIEVIGAFVLCGFLLQSLFQAIRQPMIPERAQIKAADGLIFVLDFKLAATILKTLILTDWWSMRNFALIFAIRTVVKRQMAWLEARIKR